MTTSNLLRIANEEATVWEGSTYYDDALKWNHVFWGENTVFVDGFKKLDLETTLELACGHGRHSEHVLKHFGNKVKRLIMMDILSSNVAYCKERIRNDKVTFIKNDGAHLSNIENESCTSIFCYDAMVHFDRKIVLSYLRESNRVLRSGGLGLFHHSNYTQDAETTFSQNPHARAFMSAGLFAEYAEEAGLSIVEQNVIRWGLVPDLDCVTLVAKRSREEIR